MPECPICGLYFDDEYDRIHNSEEYALANFKRHLKACAKQERENELQRRIADKSIKCVKLFTKG